MVNFIRPKRALFFSVLKTGPLKQVGVTSSKQARSELFFTEYIGI